MNADEKKKRNPTYTIRKVSDNLHSAADEVTWGTDVKSEPFPFSEEDYDFLEQEEFIDTNKNEP
jgi:hypothetical protein